MRRPTSRRLSLSEYKKPEVNPEEEILRTPYPNKKEGEMFGIADQLLGASRIKIMCADGKSRMGRIPGKIRKRMWIREGDLVIVKPWDFQDDKADILYRYTKTQASYLSRKKALPKNLDVF
jgi:translation initiation factor 1A